MATLRFELSDGSSNKFWQIARDGASLLVTFGKIGTSGQAQKKDLASEAAAIAEHDKLVKEKTKKGYVAVGAPASSAPAPTPKVKTKPADGTSAPAASGKKAVAAEEAPAPVVVVPKSAGDYVLEERWTGKAHTLTDGSYEALLAAWFPPGGSHDVDGYVKLLIAGRKATAAKFRPAVDEIVALLKGDKKAPIGAVAAELLFRVAPPEASVPYLVDRFGIGFVVDVLLGASGFNYGEHADGIVIGTAERYALPEAARVIAACEDRAKPADWKKAVAALRAEREKAKSLSLRAECNVVIRDEAFVKEDLAATRGPKDWTVDTLVFFATRDPEVQGKLAAEVGSYVALGVMGVAAQAYVLPAIENDNFIVSEIGALETVMAARTIAKDLSNKNSNKEAREYYARRPDLALRALVPIVVSGGKLAIFAKPVVEATVAAHPALPAIVAPFLDAKSRAFFAQEKKAAVPEAKEASLPEALRREPVAGLDGYPKKIAPLPEFASTAIGATQVRLEGTETALPASVVQRLLQSVRYQKGSAIVAEAKKVVSRRDLARLGWEVFERWQAEGAPNKEGWGFTALGQLGDDDTARALTPLVRAWPGESLHARAAVGLDVLATIGTDVALMHLHGIAQKLKFKALQEKAREKIAEVAAARGFTADELADRLVPDFDLGDEGGDVLDFGPRSFTIVFDESLKPQLKGQDGKVVGDLPKPGKNDDAAKANAATERWKALKKDAKTVAAGLVLRFELAMCDERRWKADVFRTFLVEHPLVKHVVRRLVWAAYDGKGKLVSTFRVAEDGTYADDRDAAFTLPEGATVGLVHRLGLDEATLGRWSTLFGDYEILQPFDQLVRQVFEPTAEEKSKKHVDHLGKTEVKTSRLMGLEARGWRKGEPQDAGWVWDMWRRLGNGIVARFTLEGGICMGYAEGNPTTQKIGPISFTKGDGGKELGLDAIGKIVFSELAREREHLRE